MVGSIEGWNIRTSWQFRCKRRGDLGRQGFMNGW